MALETIQNILPPLKENAQLLFFMEGNGYKANRPEQLTTSNYSHGHCGEAAAAISNRHTLRGISQDTGELLLDS